MKKIITALLLINTCSIANAQHLQIISINHIGGNGDEQISTPGVINHSNDFSFIISHNSSSGSIKTGCPGMVMLNYDQTYTMLPQTCQSVAATTNFIVLYVFPQQNGDTILIGQLETTSTSHDIAIERRNASGNVIWSKAYGGTASDGISNVIETTDGGFFISAASNSNDGDVGSHYGNTVEPDIWIIKLDNNGNLLWSNVIGGSGTDLPRDLALSGDGGCYIFGTTTSVDHDATGNHGSSDLYIVKMDSSGNKVWHKCLGGSADDGCAYDYGVSAVPDNGSGFYILNRSSSQDGDVQKRHPDEIDFWLLHVDSSGGILWETTFGGPSDQYPSALAKSADGSLWMSGYFYGGTTSGGQIDVTYGNTDAWVVHADSLGNFINQRVIGSEKPDNILALHPLPDGTVVAAGEYYANNGPRSPGFPINSEGNQDVFIARFGPQTVNIDVIDNPLPEWSVYPNPTTNYIEVKISGSEKFRIEVYDINGRQLLSQKFKNSIKLNMKNYPTGEYVFQITDNKGEASRKKIIYN